jgi:hypothetical protein
LTLGHAGTIEPDGAGVTRLNVSMTEPDNVTRTELLARMTNTDGSMTEPDVIASSNWSDAESSTDWYVMNEM